MVNDTAMLRNAAVRAMLRDMRLMSVNVTGDGSCFYRALSLILHGNEDHHTELRRPIADHLTRNYDCIFNVSNNVTQAGNFLIEQHIQRMRLDGVWAGEEAILAAADFLQRELHVFKYVTSAVASLRCTPQHQAAV